VVTSFAVKTFLHHGGDIHNVASKLQCMREKVNSNI